jgi:signal transduction histidine kinase
MVMSPLPETALDQLLQAERLRIARELHDSVAQQIITIGMHLEWCRAQLPEGDPLHGRICASKELARDAVAQMRRAIFALSDPPAALPGLGPRLGELAASFARLTGLRVRTRVRGEERALPAEAEHALLRIAQEALFNAHKHAQARQVAVELAFKPGAVQLLVSDDGVGIGATLGGKSTGSCWGLRTMGARARELGGTCVVAPRRRGGTQVRVSLPARAMAEAGAHG